MPHPLVDQFRFTRREWLRGLEGVTEEQAARHFGQMNSISWIVGHLAWHEQRTWLTRAQGIILFPELNTTQAVGAPMSTPSYAEMMSIWRRVTEANDPFLEKLDTPALLEDHPLDGNPSGQTRGDALRRITYHYWYHTGEILAIRQLIGGKDLPEYVGDLESEAPYRPE